jgi:hypothetical protein
VSAWSDEQTGDVKPPQASEKRRGAVFARYSSNVLISASCTEHSSLADLPPSTSKRIGVPKTQTQPSTRRARQNKRCKAAKLAPATDPAHSIKWCYIWTKDRHLAIRCLMRGGISSSISTSRYIDLHQSLEKLIHVDYEIWQHHNKKNLSLLSLMSPHDRR